MVFDQSAARHQVGEVGNRPAIIAAALTSLFLVAAESTMVGTALPTIADQLGGMELYGWVFAAPLLATTVTTPLYGRLSDMYGRRRVFLVGLGLFLAGSMLAGTSQNMGQLVGFRLLQGTGAGAVLPITLTVIGDLFTLEERARIQGLLSAIWGTASLVGPLLGGMVVTYLNWRMVFYLNLPIGILAGGLYAWSLRERVPSRQHRLDWAGAVLFSAGALLLLLAMQLGGRKGEWLSPQTVLLVLMSGLLLALFLRVQANAPEPMMPLDLLQRRDLVPAILLAFATGAVLLGVTSFQPLFVQSVLGGSVLQAGLVLSAMSCGWLIGATSCARLLLVIGFRRTALLGAVVLSIASLALLLQTRVASWAFTLAVMVGCGAGVGMVYGSFINLIQYAVGWERRGIATAVAQFSRSLGGTIGVAIMGTLLSSGAQGSLAVQLQSVYGLILAIALMSIVVAHYLKTCYEESSP